MPLYNGYFYPVIQKQEILEEETGILASGSTKQFTSGEDLQTGNIVYSINNKIYKADAEILSSSFPIGISLETKTIGNLTTILIGHGNVTYDFNNLTSGKRYFLGKTGSITEMPSHSNIVQIGFATSDNELIYFPSFIIQR